MEASTPSSPSFEAEASTSSSSLFEAEPSTPSPPPTLSWTEKLRLALPMDKVFPPYQPPSPLSPAERKQAQLLLAAFSHLPFNVLEDDIPLKNFRWACDVLTRGYVLNPLAQAELHLFLDQLPVLLYWHRNSMVTMQSLDQLSSLRIQAQYEAENFTEEFDDFKNKDSAYWDDLIVDELEQRLREEAFEIKAEELYYEVRAHQLMQPTLEEIEDIIKKEQKFIDHCWTKFHDLVIYSIPYFYELEFVPR
ncbi:uncharacterized protein LOC114274618 [Camellia sinensis]|uniref:uncharacterized protein LOC114274618 n=1 Tax=Camellia sinensis TaxID=4442 RepID=UPI0010360B63|nr:uncharacterized protein LOC114274618 [Camellia sinensis]